MLDRSVYPTEEFKKQSKYYVFVKINGDQQPSLMTSYGVSGFPTIKFMNTDLQAVAEIPGYEPLAALIADMDKHHGGN